MAAMLPLLAYGNANMRSSGMAKSYYSIVLDHSADEVWAFIRSFGDYAWSGVAGETIIEGGRSGDQVGAIRCIRIGGEQRRQQLLAHSDVDRSYSYGICDPSYLPVHDYRSTIRVVPVVESNKAFAEWWATFDCAEDARERWTNYFAHDGFAKWLGSLRNVMGIASSLRSSQ
jgi:hypothetical protein